MRRGELNADMLLTVTCEAERATDLGYLLFKNPASAIAVLALESEPVDPRL